MQRNDPGHTPCVKALLRLSQGLMQRNEPRHTPLSHGPWRWARPPCLGDRSWRHSTARLVLRARIAPSTPRYDPCQSCLLPPAPPQICPTATQHAFQNQCVRLSLYVCWRMLTCADMCWRVLTYADVYWRILTCADACWRMLTYADICWHMLTCADLCWRMLTWLTYADLCWRMLTYTDVCWRMFNLNRALIEPSRGLLEAFPRGLQEP